MAQEQLGLDWEEDFQRLTPSQFFRKNKQMLGFTGKIRSLTIVFHELITNSFDAAEESGIRALQTPNTLSTNGLSVEAGICASAILSEPPRTAWRSSGFPFVICSSPFRMQK